MHIFLRKRTTNLEALIQLNMGEIPFSQEISTLACEKTFEHKPNKALGILWFPREDKFQFNPEVIKQEAVSLGDTITKKKLFSLAVKIYDPLGMIALVHLQAKIAMPAIWLEETKWGQAINPERVPAWRKFISGMDVLEVDNGE